MKTSLTNEKENGTFVTESMEVTCGKVTYEQKNVPQCQTSSCDSAQLQNTKNEILGDFNSALSEAGVNCNVRSAAAAKHYRHAASTGALGGVLAFLLFLTF